MSCSADTAASHFAKVERKIHVQSCCVVDPVELIKHIEVGRCQGQSIAVRTRTMRHALTVHLPCERRIHVAIHPLNAKAARLNYQ
jgi:hypothetical protein